MSENVTLTRNQARALAALLAAPTLRAAAEACGMSEKTIARYMAMPEFRAALTQAEAESIDGAGRLLVAGQAQALAVLADVMSDPNARPGDRRAAAVAWLDLVLKWREMRTTEQRLADLEAAVYDPKNKTR